MPRKVYNDADARRLSRRSAAWRRFCKGFEAGSQIVLVGAAALLLVGLVAGWFSPYA